MSHSGVSTASSRSKTGSKTVSAPFRHGRLKSAHPLATIAKFVGAAVAVVAISGASVGGAALYTTYSALKPGIHLDHVGGNTKAAPPIGAATGEINILLAGSDTRTGQVGYQSKAELAGSSGLGNNDVTMLLHVSADHTNATVISFPRDLVSVPICGKASSPTAMFNSTLSRGLSCTVDTVEKMTGLTIPYAAVITFDGVIGMSNAVGGVTVCLASKVHDNYTNPPLNLAAGSQTLVGPEALSFLRSRHGVGDGSDLGRISNQQVFLSALVRKITTEGALKNPITMFKLATAAVANLQPSDTLTNPTTLVSLALTLKAIPLANIVFVQYPTIADPADTNRVIPAVASAAALNNALRSGQPIALGGKLGVGATVDPTSTAATTPVPTTPSATGTPTVTPTTPPVTTVTLPADITGQSSSQATCTSVLASNESR